MSIIFFKSDNEVNKVQLKGLSSSYVLNSVSLNLMWCYMYYIMFKMFFMILACMSNVCLAYSLPRQKHEPMMLAFSQTVHVRSFKILIHLNSDSV